MTAPQRPALGRRSLGAILTVVAWLGLAALSAAGAQSILYTVQVVALSDVDSARQVQTDLLRQGYPAYIVRSHSTEGAVYRVRVGAYANRPAALLYSEAMPVVAGGQPVPALAEGIPSGVTPLAPRLVLAQDLTGLDARMLLIGPKLALRTQQRSPLEPARYNVMDAGQVETVTAWQLSENDAGERVIVRDLNLWPDSWEGDTAEVRELYQKSMVGLVADSLGLDQATVRAARYGTQTGVPKLIVVERIVPGAPDGPQLIGLGLPAAGMTPSGPLSYLGVSVEELPGVPEGVRLDLATGTYRGQLAPAASAPGEEQAEGSQAEGEQADSRQEEGAEPGTPEEGQAPAGAGEPAEEAQAEETNAEQAQETALEDSSALITGSTWYAQADGPFVRLTMHAQLPGASPTTWRAAFGTPLWSGLDYLLAYQDRTVLIYDFLPRD